MGVNGSLPHRQLRNVGMYCEVEDPAITAA